jgi:hypothetical protein
MILTVELHSEEDWKTLWYESGIHRQKNPFAPGFKIIASEGRMLKFPYEVSAEISDGTALRYLMRL